MELVIVLAIALLVLGPKRLPDAGKAIGKSVRGFKESLSGPDEDDEGDATSLAASTAPRATPRPAPHTPPR
jgi:sec-independent protein translocase protein TatA